MTRQVSNRYTSKLIIGCGILVLLTSLFTCRLQIATFIFHLAGYDHTIQQIITETIREEALR